MKYELKHVSVFPVIKVTFIVSLILGFFLGIIYAFFMGAILTTLSRMGGMQGQGFDMPQVGFGALLIILPVIMSIMSAVFNTILAVIGTLIYNFVTKFAGGFEMEFQGVEPPMPSPPNPMDIPGAIYAQTGPMRYTPPPPPPQYQPGPPPQPPTPPPTPPSAPTPPDRKDEQGRPPQFPFE